MRRHLLLLAGFTLAGLVLGVVAEHLPRPHAHLAFWVGNLSSTWIVVPFLAGWAQRSRIWAAIGGAMAAEAMVVGFYAFLGHPWSLASLMHAFGFWLLTDPTARMAAIAGPLYGLLGSEWGRSRWLPAGIAVGVPFLLEPWLWGVRLGYVPHPFVIWIVEGAVGAAILIFTTATWRRRRVVPV
jgi:hypothetical protein